MTELMRRRRALMGANGKSWEEISFPYNGFSSNLSSTNTKWTVDAPNKTVRVYTTSNRTYGNASAPFTTNPSYEYRYTMTITTTKGEGYVSCRNSTGQTQAGTQSQSIRDNGDVDVIFQHNPNISKISLFCTYATSEAGDVLFSNIHLYRRPA